MFFDALEYPSLDDEWLKKIIIGGVLSLLSFLILPLIFVTGYYMKVAKYALQDRQTLPDFNDWGNIFTLGFSAVIISIAYPLLSMPFFLLSGLLESLEVILLIFGFIGLFGSIYLLPVALCNYLRTSDLTEAFNSDVVLAVGGEFEYLKTWFIALAIAMVGYSIGGALTFLLVGVFINFYVGICLYYLFGRSCSEIFKIYRGNFKNRPNL